MKKIAFYSRAFYTGGMENAVYNLCLLLNKTGEYEIDILFNESNDKTEIMMNKLATVGRLEYAGGRFKGYDVLINCDRKEFVLPFISARKTIHWFSSCLIQNIEHIQGQVISQSKYHYDRLKKLGIESKIIGNPLDVNNILDQSNEEIKKYRTDDEVAFLVVSRISHEKGFMRIAQFMLNRRTENCKLYIVGGVTSAANEDIKNTLIRNLRNKVVFLGEKDNPYPYMRQADYILCLSDGEIYGLVSEEAHILGKQVIFNHYETANDQFINGFDNWFDGQIVKYDKSNVIADIEIALARNENRFAMWKGVIDDET